MFFNRCILHRLFHFPRLLVSGDFFEVRGKKVSYGYRMGIA